jgi:hypothetical protein
MKNYNNRIVEKFVEKVNSEKAKAKSFVNKKE